MCTWCQTLQRCLLGKTGWHTTSDRPPGMPEQPLANDRRLLLGIHPQQSHTQRICLAARAWSCTAATSIVLLICVGM